MEITIVEVGMMLHPRDAMSYQYHNYLNWKGHLLLFPQKHKMKMKSLQWIKDGLMLWDVEWMVVWMKMQFIIWDFLEEKKKKCFTKLPNFSWKIQISIWDAILGVGEKISGIFESFFNDKLRDRIGTWVGNFNVENWNFCISVWKFKFEKEKVRKI